MIRMVSTLFLALFFTVGIGQALGTGDSAEPQVEISEEDREIAEIIELLELLELLTEMENVTAQEEKP